MLCLNRRSGLIMPAFWDKYFMSSLHFERWFDFSEQRKKRVPFYRLSIILKKPTNFRHAQSPYLQFKHKKPKKRINILQKMALPHLPVFDQFFESNRIKTFIFIKNTIFLIFWPSTHWLHFWRKAALIPASNQHKFYIKMYKNIQCTYREFQFLNVFKCDDLIPYTLSLYCTEWETPTLSVCMTSIERETPNIQQALWCWLHWALLWANCWWMPCCCLLWESPEL